MPNHIHLIIELGEYNHNNGIANVDDANVDGNDGGNVDGFDNVKKIHEFSLLKIMGKLNKQTSKHMNDARKTLGQKNWQSDYHKHVIRDDKSYLRIKTYIRNNPANWDADKFHAS